MNRSLHHLFIAVIVLFAVIAASTTYTMTIRASSLNQDSRNARSLYRSYSVPRGAILAADGTILAQSVKTDDAFQYQRKYPQGPIYAPVTGYFSITNRADRGIEASQNALLTGQSDSLWLQRLKADLTGDTSAGANIETSIDPKLQTLAYKLLGSQTGAVVAMEPSTGRILVMVSTPSYDPNILATHDTTAATNNFSRLAHQNPSPLINNAISQLFPPGSTFKTVISAAAIESGKYKPETPVSSPSTFTLPGTSTQLTNSEYFGWGPTTKIPMADAFAYSSNTAFAQVGLAVGSKPISSLATDLGFGSSLLVDGSSSTGIPMKAAASQFPLTDSDGRPISQAELALQSIGQGSTVETPLQNVMITSAVANKGTLMRPSLVDRVRSSDLTVISQTSPSTFSKPFSTATADSLTAMMEGAVTKSYPQLQIAGTKVAAKTGTAQTGNNSTQDGWITGFVPADKPTIAISVVIKDAQGFGVQTAGPIMKQLMEEYLDETH